MWVNGWLASNFLIGATDKSSEEILGCVLYKLKRLSSFFLIIIRRRW